MAIRVGINGFGRIGRNVIRAAQSMGAKELDFVKFPPATPGIGEITTPTFELAVNKAVLGKADPKAALDEATNKANQLLAENAKKYGG